MTDLQPLTILLGQAERQRDAAIAEHQRAQAASDASAAQAEQLRTYRKEYEQRWSAEFCREGKIELVRCYQGFIHRLTQAVEQQERVAAHAAIQVERAEARVAEPRRAGRRRGAAALGGLRADDRSALRPRRRLGGERGPHAVGAG